MRFFKSRFTRMVGLTTLLALAPATFDLATGSIQAKDALAFGNKLQTGCIYKTNKKYLVKGNCADHNCVAPLTTKQARDVDGFAANCKGLQLCTGNVVPAGMDCKKMTSKEMQDWNAKYIAAGGRRH